MIDNAEAGYDWSTYPERLAERGHLAGRSIRTWATASTPPDFWGWTDDAYIGNYGDNSLLYFFQYQNAPAAARSPQKARTGTNIAKSGTLFDIFRQDVLANKLPQVSWIVAPEAYTEHPNWPANYGAWYVSQILDALTANPEVWSKTVFFLMYDENDGFFDHMVPPTPPQSRAEGLSTVDTTNELFAGNAEYAAGPYGLGVRVPMIVISPWSKGGWVSSEVFDHTSLIRFIERRFGGSTRASRSRTSPWRRAVTGDLTSAFDFASPNDATVPLPSTIAYVPPDNDRHPDYVPTPPADQALPAQEPGTRPARALPYELHVDGEVNALAGNHRTSLPQFRQGRGGLSSALRRRPDRTVDVHRRRRRRNLRHLRRPAATARTIYRCFGPNGFLRAFAGGLAGGSANLTVRAIYDKESEGITLVIHNHSGSPERVSIADAYSGKTSTHLLQPHDTFTHFPAA